ncbi:MAG: T9SS type A sorting domain-containing protein [Saprospiraceae bacterium]|nr:T9SS type A sorting domain-containing protein [Saprospiraceae bacterium]
MKAFLSFLLAIVAFFSASAQVNIPEPTRELIKIAADPFSVPSNYDEVFHYYNANAQRFESKVNRWNGSSWELYQRIYYTYDNQGQLTETLTRQWDNTLLMLTNSRRVVNSYNQAGQLLSSKSYNWNASFNFWWLNNNIEYFYDENGLALTNIFQTFQADGQQLGGYRDSTQYDAEGRISLATREIYVNDNWQYLNRRSYSYTGTGDDNYQFFTQEWDFAINNWGPAYRRTTVTTQADTSLTLAEVFLNDDWQPSTLRTETYNTAGQLTQVTTASWDQFTNTWKVTSHVAYDYNADFSYQQFRYSVRDAPSDIFYLWIVVDYDYAFYPVNTTAPALQAKVSLSPNPVADFARIKVENPENQPVTFAFFDAGGRLLQQWTTRQENSTLHMAAYSPGAYYLRVMREGAVKTLPFIKH